MIFLNEEKFLEFSKDLICPICMGIFQNPMMISKNLCFHTFCEDCINTWLSANKKYPECRIQFSQADLNPERIARNLVAKLRFSCTEESCEVLSI